MKVCPKCQFIGNENELYCVKCGTLLEETSDEVPQGAPEAQENVQTPPYAPYTYPTQQPKEEISVGKWVLYHLIPCIPVVGSLVYIVMLFVWGFGTDKNDTFRNWAKAQLIMMAIALGIVVLIMVFIFVVLGLSFAEFASEMTPY